MKTIRTIISVILVAVALLPAIAFAEPIDSEFAKSVGKFFVESEISSDSRTQEDYARRSKDNPLSDSFPSESEVSKVTPLYSDSDEQEVFAYVLELEPAGYVVMSADTDIDPVIAYSYSGEFSFEEASDNTLLYLLKKDMSNRIKAIPRMSQDTLTENQAKWYNSSNLAVRRDSRDANVWGPWVTTEWSQSSPYNDYLPMDSVYNERSVVGCVATAMAQILYYYNYPTSVSFSSKDAYTTSSRRIRIDTDASKNGFLSFTALNSMLSDIQYDGSSTEIAALSFAAGISVKMDYTSDGSGATDYNAANAFKSKFGYSSLTYYQTYSPRYYGQYANSATILSALQSDMKQAKPAVLGISGRSGGHALIVDGYKSTGEYHLNMGWGGRENAWYFLPKGLPSDLNTISDAIVNITAVSTAKSLSSLSISGSSSVNANSYADYTATATFSDGSTQDVTATAVWSENSAYSSMDTSVKGRLRTASVTANQPVTLSAIYTYNGITKTASKSLTITPSVTLTSLSISGASSVNANSYADYTATATFSDGSTQNITVNTVWSENSAYASMDASVKGRLRTASVTANRTVTLTARYTYGSVSKTASKSVTIIRAATKYYGFPF